MTGAEVLRDALLAHPLLVDLVGTRVRVDAAEERDEYPFIVFRRRKVDRDFGLDNTLLATMEQFEIECWAAQRLASLQVEAEVVDALLAAGLVPDENPTDALDPDVDVRAAVVYVTVWT